MFPALYSYQLETSYMQRCGESGLTPNMLLVNKRPRNNLQKISSLISNHDVMISAFMPEDLTPEDLVEIRWLRTIYPHGLGAHLWLHLTDGENAVL